MFNLKNETILYIIYDEIPLDDKSYIIYERNSTYNSSFRINNVIFPLSLLCLLIIIVIIYEWLKKPNN